MMDLIVLPIAALGQEAGPLFSARAEASGAWFSALASGTLGRGEDAFLAALRGRTGFVSALPLVRAAGGAFRALTAPYSTKFGPAALSGADAYALGAKLGRLVSRRLDLDAMDVGLPLTGAFLDGLQQSGLVTASYRHFANWYEDIESFESFWATRPARLRETVRRKGRKVREMGGTFVILSAPREIENGMASYRDIYADSGKIAEPHPDFMGLMTRKLSARGDVRLGLLLINGEPVAVQLWLLCGRGATIFKLAHREKFSACSPGTLLTHWMFSQLVPALQIKRVDFGRGDDLYKRDWLRFCTFRRGIIACNPTNLAGLRDIAIDIFPTWTGRVMRQASGTA
jgi:CelD/BcsL family acetyltransferase involved in cellulose biosynthesis